MPQNWGRTDSYCLIYPEHVDDASNPGLDEVPADEVARLGRESLAAARQEGDLAAVADILSNLGRVESRRGRKEEARHCFEESLLLAQQVGDSRLTRWVRKWLTDLEGTAQHDK
jgi:hypothetical protein